MDTIRKEGDAMIRQAEANQMPIIVLCGRPYHLDPEINHGSDKLITSLGACIVTEDVISNKVEKLNTTVLNQWTYHARLYAAAEYICDKPQFNLVQLVSFGCGIDAITTDEVRSILELSLIHISRTVVLPDAANFEAGDSEESYYVGKADDGSEKGYVFTTTAKGYGLSLIHIYWTAFAEKNA